MSQILSSSQTAKAQALGLGASRSHSGEARVDLLRSLASAIRSLFRNSLRGLTYDQSVWLEELLLKQLAKRTILWGIILFIGSILVFFLGDRNPTPRSLPMNLAFTTNVWMGVLWTLLLITAYVSRKVILLSSTGSTLRRIRLTHLLLCAWIVCLALFWFGGSLTLLPPQPPNFVPGKPPPFIFGQTTFIFFTLIGQVIAIVLLAPSRAAATSAIAFGFLFPFFMTWLWMSHQNPFFYQMIFWIGGQGGLDLALAWFVGTDQRRIYARGVRAEAERQRADNFVATISHDLRQPVPALALKLSVMKDRHALSDVSSDVLFLQDQVRAIEQMVVGTLDLSRLKSDTLRFDVRPVPLDYLLEDVARSLQAEAASIGSEIEVRTLPYLVSTDATALDRIIRNLINNALRYSGKNLTGRAGRVVVDCTLEGNMMRVSVTDNGIGIPELKRSDIFKEYVQLENPERDSSKGLGLGLSIVKGFADLLGHQLDVESCLGEWSRFSILVPAVGLNPPELVGRREYDKTMPDLEGMVVLVIEDAPGPRETICEQLAEWSCCVIDGESAEDVLAKLETERDLVPDFILADYRLRQGTTGLEAVKAVRAAVGVSALPGAIWTAETDPNILRKIDADGLALVSKPPKCEVLLELLAQHVRRRELSS